TDNYCSLAYSALACFRTGMSGSASSRVLGDSDRRPLPWRTLVTASSGASWMRSRVQLSAHVEHGFRCSHQHPPEKMLEPWGAGERKTATRQVRAGRR